MAAARQRRARGASLNDNSFPNGNMNQGPATPQRGIDMSYFVKRAAVAPSTPPLPPNSNTCANFNPAAAVPANGNLRSRLGPSIPPSPHPAANGYGATQHHPSFASPPAMMAASAPAPLPAPSHPSFAQRGGNINPSLVPSGVSMTADSASFVINTNVPTGVPPGFPTTNLNLQQTIFLIDKRVSFLETSLYETRNHVATVEQSVQDTVKHALTTIPPTTTAATPIAPPTPPTPVQVSPDSLPDNLVVTEELEEAQSQLRGEFMERFDMLAAEVGELKDIVMKLQAYTLDINRTLLDRMGFVDPSSTAGADPADTTTSTTTTMAPSAAEFSMSLPTFSLSNFVSTTAAGNDAVQTQATPSVVSEIVVSA